MMTKNETIFKLSILVVFALLAFPGCKEYRYDIVAFNKMSTVVIEFDIPKNNIVNSKPNSEQENQVRKRICKGGTDISNLRLQFYSQISGIDYYEYVGDIVDDKVVIFVFDTNGDITIRGFKHGLLPDLQSRYSVDNNGLDIYKKIQTGTSPTTVNIHYQFDKQSISFGLDDGFSKW